MLIWWRGEPPRARNTAQHSTHNQRHNSTTASHPTPRSHDSMYASATDRLPRMPASVTDPLTPRRLSRSSALTFVVFLGGGGGVGEGGEQAGAVVMMTVSPSQQHRTHAQQHYPNTQHNNNTQHYQNYSTCTSSRRTKSWLGCGMCASKMSSATLTSAGCATHVPSWPALTSRSLSARTFF